MRVDWFSFQTAATAPGALVIEGERFAPMVEQLTKDQAKGCRALVDEFTAQGLPNIRWLAYILATALHETGGTMQPAVEDLEAAARQPHGTWYDGNGDPVQSLVELPLMDGEGGVETVKRPSGIPLRVGQPIEPGKTTLPAGQKAVAYYGRGYLPRHTVSRRAYLNVSRDADMDLVSDPDVLLEPRTAAKAMIGAMMKGSFSGKGLERFFAPPGRTLDNGMKDDWYDARQSLGGVDDADAIAATAKGFHKVLLASAN